MKNEEIIMLLKDLLQVGAFSGDRLPIKVWRHYKAKIEAAIDALEVV